MKRALVLLLLAAFASGAHAADAGIFASHCAVCHGPEGKGVAGAYPPLADSVGNYVRLRQGRQYLVHVVSFGMMGPISVQGRTYSGFMQPWTQFSDDEIAQVLNHVLADFNARLLPADFTPLTAGEVKRFRATKLSFFEVHNERETLMKALSAHKAPGS